MKFVPIRELRNHPHKVFKRLPKEDVVVTHRGRPAAALVYLDEDLVDDFIFAHHPTFLSETREALAEYKKKGGIGHDEMLRKVERRRGRS
ncbi:MAG: type II toxin-antitoxin system prevent-host-death family antitoxin [Bdellovibrionota bacterium]